MTTKPTKSLTFPKAATAGAELREAMLKEMQQPVGTPPPAAELSQTGDATQTNEIIGLPVIHITGNTVSQQTDMPADRETERQVVRQADRPTDQHTEASIDRPADRQNGKARISKMALDKVKALGKGKRAQVTLKLPGDLDEYITRHVRENWEEKILKQDIITRGIQLAILEIETGVKLADLD